MLQPQNHISLLTIHWPAPVQKKESLGIWCQVVQVPCGNFSENSYKWVLTKCHTELFYSHFPICSCCCLPHNPLYPVCSSQGFGQDQLSSALYHFPPRQHKLSPSLPPYLLGFHCYWINSFNTVAYCIIIIYILPFLSNRQYIIF